MTSPAVRSPIVVTHMDGLRFAVQIRSHRLVVDQPFRSGGCDRGPGPLELLGAALGSCAALYVQQFLNVRGLPYDGLRIEVEQQSGVVPGRIGRFAVRVLLENMIPEEYVMMLERVVRSCPAHNTILEGAAIDVEILAPMPAAEA